MKKELEMLTRDPPPGISVWQSGAGTMELTAQLTGPEDSPYAAGVFELGISIPVEYPFQPPRVRFSTPIYHPNFDSDGRICLDTLKMQPQGSWSPASNISSVLLSIRLLLAHPNADDGLVPSITEIFKRSIEDFNRLAQEHTKRHATKESADRATSLVNEGDDKGIVGIKRKQEDVDAPALRIE
jgi:ubiquitin-conjugating enzyme E2 T